MLHIEHIAVLLLGYSHVIGAFLFWNLQESLMVLHVSLIILIDVNIPLRPAQRHTFLTLHHRNALIPCLVKGYILTGLEIVDIGMGT